MIKQFNFFFKEQIEKSTFGVFAYLGERFGFQSNKLRLYFIYISFITLGSPIVFYFIALFWINIKKQLRKTYTLIFE